MDPPAPEGGPARGRRPCWLVACGATFASIAFGYRPERLDQFTTTGILGAVQRNADLLAGVETRAAQTTPYLKNLLALSAALQDKYSPQVAERSRWRHGCCWCPTSTAGTSTR